MLYYYDSTFEIEPFYPCIKYKIPADLKLDGTDHFIVAESMYMNLEEWVWESSGLHCSLSFTCENNQKAFYKFIKDCLRFRMKEEYF